MLIWRFAICLLDFTGTGRAQNGQDQLTNASPSKPSFAGDEVFDSDRTYNNTATAECIGVNCENTIYNKVAT